MKGRKKRLKELADGQVAGEATRAVIEATHAAIIAATSATT